MQQPARPRPHVRAGGDGRGAARALEGVDPRLQGPEADRLGSDSEELRLPEPERRPAVPGRGEPDGGEPRAEVLGGVRPRGGAREARPPRPARDGAEQGRRGKDLWFSTAVRPRIGTGSIGPRRSSGTRSASATPARRSPLPARSRSSISTARRSSSPGMRSGSSRPCRRRGTRASSGPSSLGAPAVRPMA